MTLIPKKEYILLLVGDVLVLTLSLWLTLALRYLELPSRELFTQHLIPFTFLFGAWIVAFFLAGLYSRHTRVFRSRLSALILYTQMINMIIAALFFFLLPAFGLAPKTMLVLYLVISFVLIYVWRVFMFTQMPRAKTLHGVLIASGDDARALFEEVQRDPHVPFTFDSMVDTSTAPSHEITEQVVRLARDHDVTFLAVDDFSDAAVAAALPIIYEAAFYKKRFAIIDAAELYEEMFECVPLSLIKYDWVLRSVPTSPIYDLLKRAMDLVGALMLGSVSLLIWPIVALAIKLDDGGAIFITQERVGRFQRPVKIVKFRSMSGNDSGVYGDGGKTKLVITRVGKWLRLLRIDELPQLWNVLKGDLSLVGPRPELPTLAALYSARIPYYSARHLVAPGLMGWAQLHHHRHPHHAANIAATQEKLSYDLFYLKHRSIMVDVYIILQTVRIVLTAKGS